MLEYGSDRIYSQEKYLEGFLEGYSQVIVEMEREKYNEVLKLSMKKNISKEEACQLEKDLDYVIRNDKKRDIWRLINKYSTLSNNRLVIKLWRESEYWHGIMN